MKVSDQLHHRYCLVAEFAAVVLWVVGLPVVTGADTGIDMLKLHHVEVLKAGEYH
jgi:hypothetical protein